MYRHAEAQHSLKERVSLPFGFFSIFVFFVFLGGGRRLRPRIDSNRKTEKAEKAEKETHPSLIYVYTHAHIYIYIYMHGHVYTCRSLAPP